MQHFTFETRIIENDGWGSAIGYPTDFLYVPDSVPTTLTPGAYAVNAVMEGREFAAILYYSAHPLVPDTDTTLEIFLIRRGLFNPQIDAAVSITVVKHLHAPVSFELPEQLIRSVESDIEKTRTVLGLTEEF